VPGRRVTLNLFSLGRAFETSPSNPITIAYETERANVTESSSISLQQLNATILAYEQIPRC
jgi:hypothetical protein